MDQSELSLKDQETNDNGPVECLGKTFANDEERRAYFLGLLAEKLKDSEFRKIEGFPIGEDEDILNLSDPPYYTACPNPWIADFIDEWETKKPEKESGYHYHREPFAADVSEGKNDPIYNAHSYHTKVPHKAIMRYILHFTEPGDIVFDGFAGTGMTGVAAQMCGDRNQVISLGYQVKKDGTVLNEEIDSDGNTVWVPFSKLGSRKTVLNDLSPAATFIAYNYNTPINSTTFERHAKRVLDMVEEECGWMYETIHSDGKTKGKINYTVWSDVFVCPECSGEVVFWDAAYNKKENKIEDVFSCPHCQSELKKRSLDHAEITEYDPALKTTISQAKQVPVLINYTAAGIAGRFEKKPDDFDYSIIEKIKNSDIPYWYPKERMMEGKETRRNDGIGLTHAHHYYTKRNLWVLSSLLDKCDFPLRLMFQSIVATLCSRLVRYNMGNRGNGPLSGTLYVSSLNAESEITKVAKTKVKSFAKAFISTEHGVIQSQSFENISIPSESLDYVFIDPPFGANLNYSELSSLWEYWLKVKTNNVREAIENSTQNKGPNEYRHLMTTCFKEAYRVLKPGRWMTVEFSNTKASVWNNIQTALYEAGFIIANVSALDKKQGSFKAVTTTTAVKQDLVISAYKPNGGFEDRFANESNEEAIWDFVRTHLGYLPVAKKQNGELIKTPERDPRILFDQVVAYFVRNLRDIPLSSKEFQVGLLERFAERDGMIFLPEQVAQYDKARISSSQLRQLTIFVDDESSSIEWLRQLLNDKPQTYQEIHPKFINELSGWKKAEVQLELSTLLEQNFLKFDGKGQVPPQIHSYLSTNFKDLRNLSKDDAVLLQKAKDRWYVPNPEREEDLQKLRERDLLKQFDEYKAHTGRKLKLVRMEAVRCGFKKAWQDRDYVTIINVAEKIPQDLLQEDQKLLMWYDQAQTRSGDSF